MTLPTITPLMQPDIVPVSNDPVLYRMRGARDFDWPGDPYGVTGLIRYHFEDGWGFDNMSVPRVFWTLAGLTPDGEMDRVSNRSRIIAALCGTEPCPALSRPRSAPWLRRGSARRRGCPDGDAGALPDRPG